MTKKIMMIAGDVSGEQHVARVAKKLRETHPDWHLTGVGGGAMRAAGVDTFIDQRKLAVMGLFEVITSLPTILSAFAKVKRAIKKQQPDLLVLVDYAGFNLKVAAFAKSQGIKVLYYISPKIWAWKASRIEKIKRYVDHMAVILPFEESLYQEAGVPVTYVGSPIAESVRCELTKEEAREALSLYAEKHLIGLLPGSRLSELKRLMPLMLSVVERFPEYHFALALAPNLTKEDLKPYKKLLRKNNVWIVKAQTDIVIRACDVVVCASGTATLEVALLKTPQVVVYKMSPLTFALAKHFVKVKYVSLCNIVAGYEVVKEFLQARATADNIEKEIKRILNDVAYHDLMLQNYSGIIQQMRATCAASTNVAALIEKMLGCEPATLQQINQLANSKNQEETCL